MTTNMDEPLEQAVATLNGLIKMAETRGLGESALFLEMAKLQLQLDLNGITDDEFIALCDALENGTLKSNSDAPPSYPRPRREGDLREQRRAWQCPQGLIEPRGGRRRARQ
jgi:hypothetical protein